MEYFTDYVNHVLISTRNSETTGKHLKTKGFG